MILHRRELFYQATRFEVWIGVADLMMLAITRDSRAECVQWLADQGSQVGLHAEIIETKRRIVT